MGPEVFQHSYLGLITGHLGSRGGLVPGDGLVVRPKGSFADGLGIGALGDLLSLV